MNTTFFHFKRGRTFTTGRSTLVRSAQAASSVVVPVEGSASTVPMTLRQLFLRGVVAPRWKINNPLAVTVEQDEDNSFVISDELFAVYGVGDTEQEALDDYISSLIEYYELIAVHAKEDTPTKEQLQRLRFYIEPVA